MHSSLQPFTQNIPIKFQTMRCSSFASWLKIISPILLLLFPTFLRFLTVLNSSYFSSPSSSSSKNLLSTYFDMKSLSNNVDAPRNLLSSSRSSCEKKNVSTSLGQMEEGLSRARAAIRRAAITGNVFKNGSSSYLQAMPLPRIYRNPAAFYRSYIEMERRLKIHVYEEGDPPLLHDGPCKNIYSIEGRFIQELEMMKGGFRTKNPSKANLYFLPFSVTWMVQYIYNRNTRDMSELLTFVADYINVIASRHPFWNQTAGADHFMLSCHDWGPHVSRANSGLYTNSIRALCNANITEGFKPHKDVSIPEINLYDGGYPHQLLDHPPSPLGRPYLAFFAGGDHGPIRPILQQTWGWNIKHDPLIQVHKYLPKGVDYFNDYMLKSKFCLCPSGYEVASPRVVEAILAECVPVLLSQGYYLPFSDVLKWEEFSIKVEVENVPKLKEILEAVTEVEMGRLREGVRAVRRHFILNQPAERFDVFHMILHSLWLRRLNLKLGGSL